MRWYDFVLLIVLFPLIFLWCLLDKNNTALDYEL